MIICSCNVLTKARVLAVAEVLSAQDSSRPLTPGRVFRALNARPQCGTCFTLIRHIIGEAGLVFTCPEPLAGASGEEPEIAELAMEGEFDDAGSVR